MRQEVLTVRTSERCELLDITDLVRAALRELGAENCLCLVASPHTTAGITINEGYDPDVATDLLAALDRCVPHNGGYRHAEGNAAAHVKASLMGSSQTIAVVGGDLQLGTWQAVWFCEFDGPRSRRVVVSVLESGR